MRPRQVAEDVRKCPARRIRLASVCLDAIWERLRIDPLIGEETARQYLALRGAARSLGAGPRICHPAPTVPTAAMIAMTASARPPTFRSARATRFCLGACIGPFSG